MLFNPTVAGTFTYGNETNSALQFVIGATDNLVTGGTHIAGGYAETGGGQGGGASVIAELNNALMLGSAIDGTRDEIVLAVRAIGGVSVATVEGAFGWREI